LKKAAEIFDFFGDGLLLTTSTFFAYSVAVISSDSRSKRMTISALESMGLASIITQTAKFTAGRRRPHLAKSPSDFKSFGGFEGNYRRSFFSGHTSASFALATSLSYEVTGAKKIPFFILPLFIGISRVVSQQHWASDIVAGSGIGIWAGYLLY
jgi:membrane-associated phospholipid phosphatase